MRKQFITKQDILLESRCHKALFLTHYNPELKDKVSPSQLSTMQRGTDIGQFAWKLFDRENTVGIDASRGYTIHHLDLVENTRKIIDAGERVIFEAGFVSADGKLFCKTDILVNYMKGFNITEVKSSTKIKPPEHILDVGFQYKVLKESNVGKKFDLNIAHINREYIRKGEIEVNELFALEDVTRRARDSQPWIERSLFQINLVLNQDKVPNVPVGRQCWDVRPCPFLGHCSKKLPQHNIWEIGGLRRDKAAKIAEKGYVSVDQIPADTKLTDRQWVEVKTAIRKKEYINKDEIVKFLDSLDFSKHHYYLDFESFMPAIPLYEGNKPYQQLCFQFCLIIRNGKKETRVDFVADPGTDPSRAFIENLLEATKMPGFIIVYNETFEKTRLKDLAQLFPDLKIEIEDRNVRIRDLMEPFKQRYYYHPSFKGSHSLKVVMPALVPELSYKNLLIQNGEMAMDAYNNMQTQTPEQRIVTKVALKEYCYVDTYGMALIVDALHKKTT